MLYLTIPSHAPKLFLFRCELVRFLASGKEAKFKEVNERLGSSKSQQEKEEKKKAEVLEELKRNKEYMADHGSVMRNIDDNLKYRKTAKEVQELQQEIEGLEEQIVAIGEASAMETELRKTAGVIQSLLSQVHQSHQNYIAENREKGHGSFESRGCIKLGRNINLLH